MVEGKEEVYRTAAQVDGQIDAKLKNAAIDVTWKNSVYGIEYNVTHAAPEVTRIGNMELHASLPVQSKMRRCLVADDGVVNYYLHKDNSALREDGTPALLDGTHGQVMVEIPKYYVSYQTEGNINRVLISLNSFENSNVVDRHYVGAYKAALNRTNLKLSSVVNMTPDFRGGNNNQVNDANAATLLGKPATLISRTNFDLYANNRGVRWKQNTYNVRKNLFWLITIEYATRNHQTAYDSTLTASGYKKGALGTGPTDIVSADWSTFNSQYPALKCGLTNEFGNKTGHKLIVLNDFPTVGNTRNTQFMSYRGIENFFGDIWEWTNGINFKMEGSEVSAYVSNAAKTSDSDYLGYRFAGKLATTNGYISQITFGEHGDILPKSSSGGSSTTYFGDYWYVGAEGLRGLIAGGPLNNGAYAGSVYSHSNYGPSYTHATIGSRLCFF